MAHILHKHNHTWHTESREGILIQTSLELFLVRDAIDRHVPGDLLATRRAVPTLLSQITTKPRLDAIFVKDVKTRQRDDNLRNVIHQDVLTDRTLLVVSWVD